MIVIVIRIMDYMDFAKENFVEGALEKLNGCRVLCAMRHGPYGMNSINRFIQNTLGGGTPIPMMILKNNRGLDVSNGDVGVAMPEKDNFYILTEGDSVRMLPLPLLPDRELAFASTIHKAQGSEYGDVIIVLPPLQKGVDSPVNVAEWKRL